ncbi:MAG: hypothetical protein FWE22_04700 [Firmicutes bacterium]|nr:hypothetical protein [Bacillota bacterium]
MKKLITTILIIMSIMLFVSCTGTFALSTSASNMHPEASCRVYNCTDCSFGQNQNGQTQKPTCRVYNCIDCSFNNSQSTQRRRSNQNEYQGIMCLVYNCQVC